MAGEPKGRLRTVTGAHDVQAAVQPGGDAGRGDDVTVVDIEHVGVDGDVGVKRLELIGIGPMRGRLASRQQPGGGNGEGAEAQAHDQRAAPVGAVERLLHWGGKRSFKILPARDDDDIGVVKRLQPVRDSDAQPGIGVDRSFFDGADAEVEPRQPELRAVRAEHQARHGKMEGADAVEGDGGDNRIAHDAPSSLEAGSVPIFSNNVNRATFCV